MSRVFDPSETTTVFDWVLPVATLALVSLVGYGFLHHDVLEEWDTVVQYFAGTELLTGQGYVGWASHFWPPLQPVLLALSGSPLAAGKLIAACSFVGIGVTAYYFSRLYLGGGRLSWYASLLVCSSTGVVVLGLKVTTHALETCLAFAAVTLYSYWSRQRLSLPLLVLAAGVLSLAALTRYTSHSLALLLCLHIVSTRRLRDLGHAVVFGLVYAALQSSWWIPNYLVNGSPLATWQYQNVGVAIFPGGQDLWWWHAQARFTGILDVIRAYPVQWVENYARNMFQCAALIATHVGSSPAASLVLMLGAFGWIRTRSEAAGALKRHALLIAACGAFSALASVAFVYGEALMPVTVLAAVACAIEALQSPDRPFIKRLVVCVLALNLAGAADGVRGYLVAQKTDEGQLADLRPVNDILMADPNIHSSVVESLHPSRALYAGSRWIAVPTAGVSSLCDVLEYRVEPVILTRAAKYPANLDIAARGVDYLILDRALDGVYPFIDRTDLPTNGRCTGREWSVVYRSADATVIRAAPRGSR